MTFPFASKRIPQEGTWLQESQIVKPVQDSSGAAPSVFAKIDGAAGSAAASAPARKSERRENFAVMAKSLRSSLWECFGILSTIGGPRGGANSDRTRPNSQKMKNVFRPNDVMV